MNPALHQIERQWVYRQSILFCLFTTLLFGCLAPLCIYFAATDFGDADFHGVRIPAVVAIPLRWMTAALMCGMLILGVWMLWQRFSYPETRVAVTPDGILMPRNRWTAREEFMRFDEMREVDFTRHRGHVTFFNMRGAGRTLSLSRQMLTQSEFDELVGLIQQRRGGGHI